MVKMRFIVIDGLDAAGKDTHAYLLKKRLEEEGEDVILRSHPCSDSLFGVKAHNALLGDGEFSRAKSTFYFAFDVINSMMNINGNADTVIFVRYLCSVAYLPEPLVEKSYKFFSMIFPTSSYMFYLDVKPEDALKRLKERNEREIFENKEELRKVRKKALSIVDDWHVIDTSRPIPEAQKDIERILRQLDEK